MPTAALAPGAIKSPAGFFEVEFVQDPVHHLVGSFPSLRIRNSVWRCAASTSCNICWYASTVLGAVILDRASAGREAALQNW
jgi:hypothetical protein